MRLPIDVICGTDPPRFRWSCTTDTPVGPSSQECEGAMPSSAERSIQSLVGIAKQALMDNAGLTGACDGLRQENDRLREQVTELTDRIRSHGQPTAATPNPKKAR